MAQRAAGAPALEISNLSKSFGGAVALDSVDLAVLRGEVHGLLGQNGSGKSTLIKILSGFHEPAPGASLRLFGNNVPLPLAPGQFRRLGLGFVHQHLGLIPSLTVLENLRLSDFATNNLWRIDWRSEADSARRLFAEHEIDLDPWAHVADLAQVDRCALAIIRAMDEVRAAQESHGGEGILVLDEPTPFLPRTGVERLFALIRQVAAKGAAVIFVSHDVDEILEITDRATVLRDGRVTGTLTTPTATREDFVDMIVGRRLSIYQATHTTGSSGETAVRVENFSGAVCRDLSFQAASGEVVGLTGLIGSGFEEVPALLYGARQAQSGRLRIGEETYDLPAMTPRAAVQAGIGYLPSDRLGASGAESLPVSDNITLPSLDLFKGRLGLKRSDMQTWARQSGERHDVRPNDPTVALETLSGGNQQKVLLAKWLETEPRLLLLDEPTQGVDVGARQQVFSVVDSAAKRGTVIICASTDAEQLAQLCDCVLVFAHGKIFAELRGAELTKEEITYRCYSSLSNKAVLSA